MRTWMILASLAAAASTLDRPVGAATVIVNIFDFEFSTGPPDQRPVDPVIHVGDTIQWVWLSGLHSSTSSAEQAESWFSPVIERTGFTFSHTFTHVGVFNYYCIVHGFELPGGGAGGMSGTITVVPQPADLNGDGVVNTLDLGILLAAWTIPPATTCPPPCPSDLNHDGVVNSLDLGILLSNWTL